MPKEADQKWEVANSSVMVGRTHRLPAIVLPIEESLGLSAEREEVGGG